MDHQREEPHSLGIDAEGRYLRPNKIGRGTFSMAFFMQCMKAIGVTEVRL